MPSDDRTLMDHGRRLAELERWRTDHAPHERGPTLGEFYATYLGLPALRGLWFPGSADNTGAVYDRSGQGRTLTYNGNPVLNLFGITAPPVLMPHYDLDGTGDFFSRADEAGLDILGTETYVESGDRGLTMGGWFRFESLAGTPGVMSKQNATGNQRGYLMRAINGDTLEGRVSVDGINDTVVASAAGALVVANWYNLVLQFQPSTALAVWVNGVKAVNTTSIPASIFNNTAAFQIGAFNAGTNLLNGRWALAFLCAAYLPDHFIKYLYFRAATMFGV